MKHTLKIIAMTAVATIAVFALGAVFAIGGMFYIADLDHPAPSIFSLYKFGRMP